MSDRKADKEVVKEALLSNTPHGSGQANNRSLYSFCLTSGMGTQRPGFPDNKHPTSSFRKLPPDHLICHRDSPHTANESQHVW